MTIDPIVRALAFIDAELRSMQFRREALLHARGLIVDQAAALSKRRLIASADPQEQA